jgi:hypothetical protein
MCLLKCSESSSGSRPNRICWVALLGSRSTCSDPYSLRPRLPFGAAQRADNAAATNQNGAAV